MVCGWGFYCKASPRCEMSRPSSSCSRETRSGTKAETHAERRCRMRLKFPEFKSMIRKSMPSDLIRGWAPVFPRDKRENAFARATNENAFARRSCLGKKMERDDDSNKSHPALAQLE